MKDYEAQIKAMRNVLEIEEIITKLIKEQDQDIAEYDKGEYSFDKDRAKEARITRYCLEKQLDHMMFDYFEGGAIPPDFDGTEYCPIKKGENAA